MPKQSPMVAKPAADPAADPVVEFPEAPSPGAEAVPNSPSKSIHTLQKDVDDLKDRVATQEGMTDSLRDQIAVLTRKIDKQHGLIQHTGNVAEGANTMGLRNDERLTTQDKCLDRMGMHQHSMEQRLQLQQAAALKQDSILAVHHKLDALQRAMEARPKAPACNPAWHKRRRSPSPERRRSASPARSLERSRSASPMPSAVSPVAANISEQQKDQRIRELEAMVANQASKKPKNQPAKPKRHDGAGPSNSRPYERAPAGSVEEMRRIMAATQRKQEAELKVRMEKEKK